MTRAVSPIDRGFSGATWMPDDSIIFTSSSGRHFGRIPASGGEIEYLEIEGGEDSDTMVSPWALPGGQALLSSARQDEHFNVAVYSIADRTLRVIAEDGFTPTYVSTGHVLYQQGVDGPLMALPFDPERLIVTGRAFPVLSDLGTRVSYQVRMFTVARNGTLAYIPQSSVLERGAVVWVDRDGESKPIVELAKVIDTPRLSPDGTRIAFRTPAPNCDIWVHDVERGVTTRVTGEGDNHGIAWSPDGTRIAFARELAPHWGMLSTAADGSGHIERLSEPVVPRGFVSAFSPDGSRLLVVSSREESGADVDLVSVEDRSVSPLFHSPFDERAAVFSPDGRAIAYVSNETERDEVYVQTFPALDARLKISVDDGTEPVWSHDGKTLYFRSGRKMMAAEVTSDPTLSAARPQFLFEGDFSSRGASGLADFDVSADGHRFVMLQERSTEGGADVHVVVGWLEELAAAAPRSND